MKIPPSGEERLELYNKVIEQCLLSRQERMATYRELRSYFLFGAAEGGQAPFNKIQPTVQLLSSFIYAAETTRFNISLGASVDSSELNKIPVLMREINDLWHDSDTDIIVTEGISWSFVFNTVHIKTIWNGGIRNYLIEPDNFGVYREDEPLLHRQEACVHTYSISRSELMRMLVDHPHRKKIEEDLQSANKANPDDGYPSGLKNIIITATTPNIVGQPAGGIIGNTVQYSYVPKSDADLIEMYELYIWDDEIDDYRIVTLASPGIIIYDRKNFLVPKSLPFTKICPEPLPYYYWGQSFSAKLVPLQDWRTQRTDQIRKLLELQVKPPKFIKGLSGIGEEKMQALYRAGGMVSSPMPNASIENMKPDMPSDIFREIAEIDAMFEETAGITSVMQGKSESGVRAKGHANLLARLASSRPKQYAMRLEDSLENIAGLMLRFLQINSKRDYPLRDQDGKATGMTFIPAQFTEDFMVKVDAHSSSPIFSEDHKADIIELFKAQAVDRQTLLDSFDPPNLQVLKERLRIKEEKEAAAQQQQQQMMAAQAQQQSGGAKGANDLKNRRALDQSGD